MKKHNGRMSRMTTNPARAFGLRRRRWAEDSVSRIPSPLPDAPTREEDLIGDPTTKWCLDESSVRLRTLFTPFEANNAADENDELPPESSKPASDSIVPRVTAACGSLGSYRLVCELASGGMGSVYLAVRHGTQGFEKFIAVKSLHPHLARDREFAEMFVDEARYAGAINHPNVCSVFDFGHAGENYFIAMEFLQGKPLSRVVLQAVQNCKAFTSARHPRLVARVIADLAEGLHAVHSLKDEYGKPLEIVHRDITPQNLFVLYDGTVRITDLGIARAKERLHHTQGYVIKGKLAYMAPEQLQRRPLDTRVDIWSLGVVLWELLTLHRLFRGSNEGETVLAVTSRLIPAPSMLNRNIPKALDNIVMKALQRDPQCRYQTARELSRDLEEFLASSSDTVPNMDIAEWMKELFPHGEEEQERLVGMARDAMLRRRRTVSADESLQLAKGDVPKADHELMRMDGRIRVEGPHIKRLEKWLALTCTLLLSLTAYLLYALLS